MRKHHLMAWYYAPRGLCASLLNRSSLFITADNRLRRTLRLLPDSSEHCNSERHVLIQGDAGVGKRTLALHCWRIMQTPTRVLLTEKCHLLHSTTQLQHCLQEAQGGDLLLDNIDALPSHLYNELPALLAQSRAVRVIAIASQTVIPTALQDFLCISIPTLAERDGDVFALAKFLLQHRLQQDTNPQLLRTALKQRNFTSTRKLYIFLVNLCFVTARMGKDKFDRAVTNEALSFSDEEQFENYLTFLVGSSSLCQLVDDYGLKGMCRLLERACINNALTATRHNITLAGKMLRVPTTTLFNKTRALRGKAKLEDVAANQQGT